MSTLRHVPLQPIDTQVGSSRCRGFGSVSPKKLYSWGGQVFRPLATDPRASDPSGRSLAGHGAAQSGTLVPGSRSQQSWKLFDTGLAR